MKKLILLLCAIVLANSNLSGQAHKTAAPVKIMTLGTFHFAFPNLDAVKTEEKDKISVLDAPYQSEISVISKAIVNFRPTIIAVELTPDQQLVLDSLYALYKDNKFTLGKGEVFQLGFRTAKQLNLQTIYCVNDWGRHYDHISELIQDSTRAAGLEAYYLNSPDSVFRIPDNSKKVTSIIQELIELNQPEQIKERLSLYLLNPFKYEEEPGDFTGVDFETGRWFSRNLRIFRNIQRIPHSAEDRMLLIIGREHLNLLNLFFDVSKEFELVSPLPYLEKAGMETGRNAPR